MKIRNLLLPMLVAGPAVCVQAQTVTLRAGSTVSVQVEPRTGVVIPLVIDPAGSGGLTFGSFDVGVSWDSARLQFDSVKAGNLGAVAADRSNASSGSLSLALTTSAAIGGPAALATAYFTSTAGIGGTRLTLHTRSAVDGEGADVRAQVRLRHLDVCVADIAHWGDGNGDASVNIIDAQQIARFTVALSVANAGAIARQADVNGDGAVNIIDAQQIARYSVGLTASARVNTKSLGVPPVNAIALSDLVPLAYIGFPTALDVTPRDAVSNAINGCYPVTWSSDAPSIATVDSTGRISGVSPGRATITATSGGQSQSAQVTVLALPATGVAPFTLSVLKGSGQTAFAHETPAIKPEILVSDALGRPIPNEDVQFTVTSGAGSVPGTGIVQTAPNGHATLTGWTLGPLPGVNSLTASVSGSTSTATVSVTGVVELTMDFTMAWPVPQAGGVLVTSDVLIPQTSAHISSRPHRVVSTSVHGAGRSDTLAFKGPQTKTQTCGHCWYGAIDLNGVAPGTYWFVFMATDSIGTQVVDSVQYTVPTTVATITPTVGNPALVIGSTTQATATLRDGSGSVLPNTVTTPRPVTWMSSDTTVATVSTSGVVRAIANGTASISASREGQTGSVSITVATAPPPASLAVTAGDAQTGYPLEALKNAVSVRLLDGSGNPLSNVTVTFAVTGGGGTFVGSPAVLTNANGVATTTGWRLGALPGANTLTASASGGPSVTISATGTVALAIDFTIPWFGPQPGGVLMVGDVMVPQASAHVTSRPYPVVSTTVQGAGRTGALAYKGKTTAGQQCSDCWYGSINLVGVPSGTYWFVFEATDSIGTQVKDSVQYTVPAIVVTVTPAVGNPSLAIGSTTQATATLRDASGGVLPNTTAIPRPVVWTSSDTTVATVSIKFGLVTAVGSGTASITASREGQSGSVSVTVGSAPAPASVVVTAGDAQTGYALEALPAAVKVKVLDGSGNPLSNVTVTFSVASGGGTFVGSPTAQTDANGIATTTGWRLGSRPVANTLTASTGAGPSVTVNATAKVKLTLDFTMPWLVPQPGGIQASNDVMRPGAYAHIVARPHTITSATVRAAGRTVALSYTKPTTAQGCYDCWSAPFDLLGVAQGTYWFVFEATDSIGTYVADSVQFTTPTPVVTISVALGSAGLVPGSTTQATATLRDGSATVLPKNSRPVVWTSSDITVATVNSQGVVTAVGNGTATISASREGQTGGTTVTVSP